ncbi:hypothetical protein D3C81_1760060 [compost metagenome]
MDIVNAAALGDDHVIRTSAGCPQRITQLHCRFLGTLPGPPAENIAAVRKRTYQCNLLFRAKRQYTLIFEQNA